MCTHVLYGPSVPRSRTDFMNEVALMDASQSRVKAGWKRAATTVISRFGRSAYPIRPTDQVIWPASGMRRPDAHQLWASHDLFNLANRAFRTYRTLTPLSFETEEGSEEIPDVVHWTCPLPLAAKRCANIYTFHDLIPLKLPHTTLDDKRAFHEMCMKIVKRADHLVAVSETTRQDVIDMLGVSPERITNTYQAVGQAEEDDRSDDMIADELDKVLGLSWKGYFLFFGAVEPKKNVARLVQAYLAARLSTPLVIVAGRAWLAETEAALLSEVGAPDRAAKNGIRLMEYLPTSMLKALVRGARATVFPSLYEGFGLPVLESMASGTAVLTSSGGALREVAGDAAVTVDPFSVASIRDGFVRLDSDADLRAELEGLGRIQAGQFTPEAYQGRLQSAYKAAGVI